MDEIKMKIRAFLSRFFRKKEIGDNDDFFAMGFVNSLFAMQLVMFLERDFSISVENNDLDFDAFRTIQSVAEFVVRKQLA